MAFDGYDPLDPSNKPCENKERRSGTAPGSSCKNNEKTIDTPYPEHHFSPPMIDKIITLSARTINEH